MRSVILAGSIVAATAGLLALDRAPGRTEQPARALAPPPSDTRAVPPALHQALAHLREEVQRADAGALVISNEHYHAQFSEHGGLAITPRLEREPAPQLTWRYRARRVETATAQRVLEPVAPTISRTGDHVVDFERPGIIERYEGERTGVEQIFVLTEPPAGKGDVRIVGDVAFDGRATQADGGLAFATGGGRAPFTYSKPIAFDADRQPLPVHVELSGKQLSLVLDEAALADARFPVTVDPLFGVVTVDTTDSQPEMADIAYNADRGEFLVVYSYFANGSSLSEIRARRFLQQGDALAGVVTIASGQNDWEPHVAYDYHTDRYLVVWNRLSPSAGALGACGRMVASAGVAIGSVTCYSNATKILPYSVDVVARTLREHGPNDASFMVVWTDDMNPAARFVKAELVTGNGAQLGETTVSSDLAADSTVTYDSATDRFFIAWINTATSALRARTRSVVGVASPIITIGNNAGDPQVGYDAVSRTYLVAWDSPANGFPKSLYGRVMSGAATPAPVTGTLPLKAQAAGSATPYGVAGGPGEFLVTYGRSQLKGLHHVAVSPSGSVSGEMLVDTNRGDDQRAGIGVSQHGFIMGAHSTFDVVAEVWYARVSNTGRRMARYVHGSSGDFDGDGRSDLFVYRLGTGTYEVKTQVGVSSYAFGVTSAVPVLLDWDADGLADLATFNTASGEWKIRTTADGSMVTRTLGRGGDIPVPGDYRGDTSDEIGVFRPSTGEWLTQAHDEAVVTTTTFGQVGDQPAPADWDGDGQIEFGVWRGSTSTWLAIDSDGSPLPSVVFAGPIPLQGNFVGNARADQAFFDHNLDVWKIRDGQTGVVTTVIPPVAVSGVTMPLDYDGDGYLNIAWYDSESQLWRILGRPGSPSWLVSFGQLGDIPAGAR